MASVFDNFLVTAAADGFVRFYDFKFRLLAWYHPGGNPRANFKSIFHRCYPILVAFAWELT